VTDHRLGESFHQLAAILDGEIESILERVILEAQARELESTGGGAAV
jgi:protein subunit release factor A